MFNMLTEIEEVKRTRRYKNNQAVMKKNQMGFLKLKNIKIEIKKQAEASKSRVAISGAETKTSQMNTGHFFRACYSKGISHHRLSVAETQRQAGNE